MIDYEIYVFDMVYNAVSSLCAKGKFTSVYVPSPTGFPAGSLVELSNTTVRAKQSTSNVENFSRIMYQLDFYGKTKASCRELYKAADDEMIGMGFTRVSGTFLDNAGNVNIFRYTARYEAIIDPDGVIYRTP